MLKSKSSENFQSRLKLGKFLRIWGSGVTKSCDFYSKRHITSVRESKSIKPFCVEMGWGVTSRLVQEKK